MDTVVLKHKRTTLERGEKFISSIYFKDINLRSRLYPQRLPVQKIIHYAAPDRIDFSQAQKGLQAGGIEAKVGQAFGPTWSTHWFELTVEVPAEWESKEVRLIWNSNSEAMVWIDGTPVQGLSGENNRHDYIITHRHGRGKRSYCLYIEMACNGLFGAGDNGMINAPDENRTFTLSQAEIAVFDRMVYELIMDIEILHDMAKELPAESERGYQALYTMNDIINLCEVGNPDTYKQAHGVAQKFFAQHNGEGVHTTYAMGHAHIDTAWLWTYAETIRKAARSWSCTLRLMEKYPSFVFTCSQAQQFAWVKERYPGLFLQIQKFAEKGNFVPVGGAWVEMDGNIPSGESFVRQFLYGQRFFQKEFGRKCKEFWLPDTFGYSAQIPQILEHCGISRFLTQKISWNLVNKFPHHTFLWEGLDGSSVMTHFPPGDNYGMEGRVSQHHTFWWEGIDGSSVLSHFPPGDLYRMQVLVKEVLYTGKNHLDKGRSDRSAFLFGFGDGGHGPSEDMLCRLERLEDVSGLPRVKMATPDQLFSDIEREDAARLCTWRGELFLEMHNGTYTTHAKVKKGNRKCELLLRDAELLSSVAMVMGKVRGQTFAYPGAELERLWKLVLLNQFHDVLPGSSIGLVYKDAHAYYEEVEKAGGQLARTAVNCLTQEQGQSTEVVVNTLAWGRREVIQVAASLSSNASAQTDQHGNVLAMVKAPSMGLSPPVPVAASTPVRAETKDGKIFLRNGHLSATIDEAGCLLSLKPAGCDRSVLSGKHRGNQFVMFDDVPLYWDAWDVMDYHLETRKPVTKVTQKATLVCAGPLRAVVQVCTQISQQSVIRQDIVLDAESPYLRFDTQVKWHENRKFLKVEFPVSMHTTQASHEIQFGHLTRPTHQNTSWDTARYEVYCHKWCDVSEYDLGLALLNDCKYGISVINGVMRLSLLRSPKAPDPEADMGYHQFSYALMPHTGSLQQAGVVQQAYNLNCPLQLMATELSLPSPVSFFGVDTPQVILDTVKAAEDRPGSVVLRLYEAFGGSTTATISTPLPVRAVHSCNGLEEVFEAENVEFTSDPTPSFKVKVRPFQVVSLLLSF